MTDSDLRDLIDQLTRTHTKHVEQHGRHIGTRTQDPLLHKLARARTANIGQGAGSSLPNERVTLNVGASELYTAIHTRIRAWALAIDVPRHWALTGGQPINWTDPAQLLRAWHTRAIGIAGLDLDPYTDTLLGWTRSINDLIIDPPRRWTLNAPCPLCNHRWTLDPDGNQIDTLLVTERDPVETTATICRYCDAVWNGLDGARQLRIAIDDRDRLSA